MRFTFKDILSNDEILKLQFLNNKTLDKIYYFDYLTMINDKRVFAKSIFLECDNNIIIIGADERWRADGEDFQSLRIDSISQIDNVEMYVKKFFPNTIFSKKEFSLKCIEVKTRINKVMWNREFFEYRNNNDYWKREWDNMIVLFLENNDQIMLECLSNTLSPCIVLYSFSNLEVYLKQYKELNRLFGNWNPKENYSADIIRFNRYLLE